MGKMGKPDFLKYDGRREEPPYDTEAAPSSCTVESIGGIQVGDRRSASAGEAKNGDGSVVAEGGSRTGKR